MPRLLIVRASSRDVELKPVDANVDLMNPVSTLSHHRPCNGECADGKGRPVAYRDNESTESYK